MFFLLKRGIQNNTDILHNLCTSFINNFFAKMFVCFWVLCLFFFLEEEGEGDSNSCGYSEPNGTGPDLRDAELLHDR